MLTAASTLRAVLLSLGLVAGLGIHGSERTKADHGAFHKSISMPADEVVPAPRRGVRYEFTGDRVELADGETAPAPPVTVNEDGAIELPPLIVRGAQNM